MVLDRIQVITKVIHARDISAWTEFCGFLTISNIAITMPYVAKKKKKNSAAYCKPQPPYRNPPNSIN